MKMLWSGQETTFQGRYTQVERGRMGFIPYQRPHPPIEMGAQSVGATRRAARLADGVFFGPQAPWASVAELAELYRQTRRECGHAGLGAVGASRSLMVGASKEDAARTAAAYLEKTFAMYRTWNMQESGMVPLHARLGSQPRRLGCARLAGRLRGHP
jgi:alkanesulfonate monooxygenase SsuD/methylene tetrahydromethanopterin reductase-like flavin-dependent oxidoreductase (luciferase family)